MSYSIEELYHSLVGYRSRNGELFIEDFDERDYEELYYAILSALRDVIGDNYPTWYMRWAASYADRLRKNAHRYGLYVPQVELPLEQQSIRMQLSVLKYYISRRYWHLKYRETERGRRWLESKGLA